MNSEKARFYHYYALQQHEGRPSLVVCLIADDDKDFKMQELAFRYALDHGSTIVIRESAFTVEFVEWVSSLDAPLLGFFDTIGYNFTHTVAKKLEACLKLAATQCSWAYSSIVKKDYPLPPMLHADSAKSDDPWELKGWELSDNGHIVSWH